MDCGAFQHFSFASNAIVSHDDQNVENGESDYGSQS